MEAPWEEWEAAAAEIIETTATSTPVDAFSLATACGFEVRPYPGSRAERRDNVIYLNTRMRSQRQHSAIAHELGHFALERHEIPDSEPGARWAGGALLLPGRVYGRDLTRTAWSISKLRELHVNASATALAVRITQLRDAVATILDPTGHRKPWRVFSPWINERRLRRVSAWEQDLAVRAYDAREELRGDELCYAVPLLEGPIDEHRVIVVCELEQLSLRL
jgi:hypothetical protein